MSTLASLGPVLAAALAASQLPVSSRAPITLDEALALAARANLDLRIAQADRDAAEVESYASWAGVLPRLDLTAGFGHDFTADGRQLTVSPVSIDPIQFQQIVVTVPRADFEAYALGLQLKMPIFDGFKSWSQIARNQALAISASRRLDESRLGIAFEVTRRFYECVRAERGLQVFEGAAQRSEDLVRRTDALYEAGRAPRADTYAARVTLGNDRIAVEQQMARVIDARVSLSIALGGEADGSLQVVLPAGVDALAFQDPPQQADLLAVAKKARPLLFAEEQRVAASEQDVRAAHSGWWPAVSAQASYTRNSPWLGGSYGVYGDPSLQYVVQVGVNVAWNLFEGRATSAAVQRANVGEARARLQADQALLQVTGEIARARAAYVTLSRSAALAAENLQAAKESLRLAETRFEAGAATQLEIRDALVKLTQAQLALLQARVDSIIARADLNRSVGGAL